MVLFLPLGGFVGLAVSARQVTALEADLLALLAAIGVVAAIAAAGWGTRKPIRVNGGRLGQRPECGIASAT
jgi:hypothetical protein